ncbi:MAG: bifunctional lysylphosphatidylglycerol flippase/synthetase MprF [Vicinamibacterales bacterium]
MDAVGPRVRRALPLVATLAAFLAALEMLRLELRAVSWPALTSAVASTPPWRLGAALVLTAVNYAVLAGYDVLAFEYAKKALPRRRIAAAAVLAYAVAHSVGFAMFSGASVRYRFYSRWGVTAAELARVVVSYSITFWLGLLALGGLSLVAGAGSGAVALVPPAAGAAIGWLLVATVAAFLGATAIVRAPVRVAGYQFALPAPGLALRQLAVSLADWTLAGAVLFVLVPPGHVTFTALIGAYLVAVLAGMVSHVPGGLGVFEGLMVLLLRPWMASVDLVPALVAYRVIYYLLPFGLALVGLVIDEGRQRRAHLGEAGRWLSGVAGELAPRILAASSFFSGAVLLFSGATPALPGRLMWLDRLLPLGVIEASHFLASVVGAALIVLAQGLARRLDAAYYLTTLLAAAGIGASLLKGVDYEEALLLLAVLLALLRMRRAFDRRAAAVDLRFSGAWLVAVVGTLAASWWLGVFAFKHVDYANDLWWRFELRGDVSRFLRATVGASMVVLVAAVASLLRPVPHEVDEPTPSDLDDAAAAIARDGSTAANLVFLRDKGLLFDPARQAFVMYGVQGRTWVAMGGPVGAASATPGLIRQFVERADAWGAVPVFYEIGPEDMHRYADAGLTFVKLGEEAKVDLTTFTTEGGRGAKFRQAVRRLERDGGTFRVVPVEAVPALMPQLRDVSNDWLRAKAGAEKGFSLGFFDEAYLARFPVAVVERDGRVQAFCNLWPGTPGGELSLDLMRYASDAPKGVMDALLVHVMLWGRDHGYRTFALGMAPLAGVEPAPVPSIWQRLASLAYKHGERVYAFQGLRAFKQKFDPVWEPRYLAYPGGLQLPKILADVSALIAGGYRQILLK